MTSGDARTGPILRIFEVRARPGCVDTLLRNFASTSAAVVRDEPGNLGFVYGRVVQGGTDTLLFISLWTDLDAVRARFGDDWESSYMPPGYDDLIDTCSIRHLDADGGWNLRPGPTW